jgi:Domain of unknown function (DUF4252)
MKTNLFLFIVAAAALAAPQQFKLNLDSIASKASDSVDVSLSGATLKFAAKFLDSGDPEEAAVKKLIAGIEGIYIKHFEFKRDNMWTQADLDPIRKQLHSPEWQHIIGVTEDDGDSVSDVYLRMEGEKTTGVAILVAESRELTVINIMGSIDLEQLADLSGHFDIPKLKIPKEKKPK